MYTQQQSSKLKREFWSTFGQYMKPVLLAEGRKPGWINYKTAEKHVFFRMVADSQTAIISIELTHADTAIQQLYFEQFIHLKNLLHNTLGEEWIWSLHSTGDHGKTVSKIYTILNYVSIFEKENWPRLISFFKPRIIALDIFWTTAKYSFEILR